MRASGANIIFMEEHRNQNKRWTRKVRLNNDLIQDIKNQLEALDPEDKDIHLVSLGSCINLMLWTVPDIDKRYYKIIDWFMSHSDRDAFDVPLTVRKMASTYQLDRKTITRWRNYIQDETITEVPISKGKKRSKAMLPISKLWILPEKKKGMLLFELVKNVFPEIMKLFVNHKKPQRGDCLSSDNIIFAYDTALGETGNSTTAEIYTTVGPFLTFMEEALHFVENMQGRVPEGKVERILLKLITEFELVQGPDKIKLNRLLMTIHRKKLVSY